MLCVDKYGLAGWVGLVCLWFAGTVMADDEPWVPDQTPLFLQGCQAGSGIAGQASLSLRNSRNAFVYVTRYDSADWHGDVVRYQLDGKGEWQEKTARSFGALLDKRAADDRRIFVNNSPQDWREPEKAEGNLAPFTYANLSTEQKAMLDRDASGKVDGLGPERVAWLRGDRRQEGKLFRSRTHLLGDVINPAPVVVGPPDSLSTVMANVEVSGPSIPSANDPLYVSYERFKRDHAARPVRIFQGANDGMLHAFDEDGNERWAFIPGSVVEKLNYLTEADYVSAGRHQYFVDGQPASEDVYFDGAWHTILMAAPDRGGRGLFVLDITDPDAPRLIWEAISFTKDKTPYFDDANNQYTSRETLTYIIGKPFIAAAAKIGDMSQDTGPWIFTGAGLREYVLGSNFEFSNGGNSFVALNLGHGKSYRNTANASVGGLVGWFWPNSRVLVDFGSSGIDGLLSFYSRYRERERPISSIPARLGQSVLAAAEITRGVGKVNRSTSDGEDRNMIVIAGTGNDLSKRVKQPAYNTIYGFASYLDTWVEPIRSLDSLQEQTLTTEMSSAGKQVRRLTDHRFDWSFDIEANKPANTKSGWYVNLPPGEMVLDQPAIMGEALFVTVTKFENCQRTYWLLALDPDSGGTTRFEVFDVAGDGSFSVPADGIRVSGPPIRIGDSLYDGTRKIPVRTVDPSTQGRFNWKILLQK